MAASLAGAEEAVRALDDDLVWGPLEQLRGLLHALGPGHPAMADRFFLDTARYFMRARSASAAMNPKAAHWEPETTRLKIAFARSVSPLTRKKFPTP